MDVSWVSVFRGLSRRKWEVGVGRASRVPSQTTSVSNISESALKVCAHVSWLELSMGLGCGGCWNDVVVGKILEQFCVGV